MELKQKITKKDKIGKKNVKIVHKNSKCSNCGMSPIEGIRYICITCQTYELCSSCEKKYGEKHGHQLLMLRRPDDLEKYKDYIFKKKDLKKIDEIEKEKKFDITKCSSTCKNLKEIYTTRNNNNFIPIEIILKNNGNEQWPSPCFFSCNEEESDVKGERIKLSKCKGLAGEECKIKFKIILKNIKKTGTYKSVWQLKNENGEVFGQKFLFVIKDIFEREIKLKEDVKDKKNEEKNEEKKDYRDDLEEGVNEIKKKYDVFSTSRIRNALIRTKGNKENAIKTLFTEQKKNNY